LDITADKRAQGSLRESDLLISSLFESSNIGLAITSPEKGWIRVNSKLCRMLGYTEEELQQRTWAEMTHPEDLAADITQFDRMLAGEIESYEMDKRFYHKDGSLVFTHLTVSCHRNDDRSVRFVIASLQDISARKQAEVTVERRAQQLAALSRFGLQALTEENLPALMDEAVSLVAEELEVELSEVLELLPDGEAFLLRAGVGWKQGLIGQARVGAELQSQAGFTLISDRPVIVEDLNTETRFNGTTLLRDQGVVSGLSVVIEGEEQPFGVLGVYTRQKRHFTADDVHILQSVANTLAAAIQHRKKEQALRESTVHLEKAQRIAHLGSWERDFEKDILIWSQETVRIFGWNPDDRITYDDFMSRVHPEDLEKLRRAQQAAASGKRFLDIEYRIIGPDGEVKVLHEKGEVSFAADGTPWRLAGTVQDVTERKQAEAALRTTKELYLQLVENQPDLICRFLPDTTLTFVNTAYAHFFNRKPEELIGKRFLEFLLDEEKALVSAHLTSLNPANPAKQYEHKTLGADDTFRWHLWHDFALFDEQGQVTGFQSVGVDITERKQAEETLAKTVENLRIAQQRQRELLSVAQREQSRLQALISAMTIGILFEDNQRRVEYVNPAFKRIWVINNTVDLVGQPTQGVLAYSTHCFTQPEYAVEHALQVADAHEISERFEIALHDGRFLTQLSYPVKDTEGHLLGRLWIYEDITHERQTAHQLIYLAERDPLTGLYNRHSFQEQLKRMIATSLRRGDRFALVYFDLDEFKYINDSFGHSAGDLVLVRIAGEISIQIRSTEMLARLGGDEFAILSTLDPGYDVGALPVRIVNAISSIPFNFRGTNLRLTASVGVALFPEHGETAEELVAHADAAMYQAKNQGKNSWAVYDLNRDSSAAMMRRLTWHSQIAQALQQNGFELHYQGVYQAGNGTLNHLEVLIRMRDPTLPERLITPSQFIHFAEKSGQVLDVDRWVLRQSIALLDRHRNLPPLAVNISGRSFDDPFLPRFIHYLLSKHNVAPAQLIIELTETAAVSDMQDAQRFIEAIQRIGCVVCLDDFGSGFSTFAYLKHLNVKVLKIDGLFIRNLPNDRDNQVFVKALVEVARGLHKTTIAEFVEDAETLEMVHSLGVDLVQGYHLGHPIADYSAFLRSMSEGQ
jgi:diguanylate cyclase (GGDEF)-like protein/PAS domain S-box-containing protein